MKGNVPCLYFAGKISKWDWRHALIPSLYRAEFNRPFDCGSFVYTGPFFVACDHGCAHGAGTHGLDNNACTAAFGAPQHWTVPALCAHWISQADLVFAWIDRPDCFNSLVEIGWAHQMGVRVYAAFGSQTLASEMWFAAAGPGAASGVYRRPADALNCALELARSAA